MEHTESGVALKQQLGRKVYAVMAATLAEVALKAVRESHEFLTDSNHAHAEGPQSIEWGGKPLASNAVVRGVTNK